MEVGPRYIDIIIFCVTSKAIGIKILPTHFSETTRNNLVTLKVNMLIWRMYQDRLITNCNLDKNGIDILMLLCPFCYKFIKSLDILFNFGSSRVWMLNQRLINHEYLMQFYALRVGPSRRTETLLPSITRLLI